MATSTESHPYSPAKASSQQKIHLGQNLCFLCRQRPVAGRILSLSQAQIEAAECDIPCAGCSYAPRPNFWCHHICYDILQASYEPQDQPTMQDLERLANATKPSCKPKFIEGDGDVDSAWEGLSSDNVRKVILHSFGHDLLYRLPDELRILICKFVAPCWYLIVLGETRRLIQTLRYNRETQWPTLRLTREIWLSRINYRGTRYVARLNNRPLEASSITDQECITLPDSLSQIVLLIDYLGLRGIQFVGHDSVPLPDGSPWYEILEIKDSQCLKINVDYNSIYVRNVNLISDEPSSAYRVWSSPAIPSFRMRNYHRIRDNPRLHYMKIDNSTRGLIAYCSNDVLIGLHTFTGLSKTFREFVHLMYKRANGSFKYWIYFPLNKNEHLTSAWVRRFAFRSAKASRPAPVIQTSLGRSVTFGPWHLNTDVELYEYHALVDGPDGAISGIFHDGLDPDSNYITEFGVTCSDVYLETKMRTPPMNTDIQPLTLSSKERGIQSWYVTRASLHGLVMVRICTDRDQPHSPCLGMLLFYRDEHIESLGQVRWDKDLTQEVVHPTFLENATVDGKPYIKGVYGDIDRNGFHSELGQVQELPRSGTIAWWFGQRGDKIVIY
ncbi:hypothetical protein BDV25DRAFT_127481 [Aspergillus avenaceus]|uniref:Uncharacterized protein n=1 Tax=Aspergillus avenaceus TaxID=36643 RepID=A0A5N6U3L1_ASPAV|nr:hypothetical protein BDV25DRAFT_127481 [Aspergillus avenaceus]